MLQSVAEGTLSGKPTGTFLVYKDEDVGLMLSIALPEADVLHTTLEVIDGMYKVRAPALVYPIFWSTRVILGRR